MYRLTVWVESRWETARVETEWREMAAYTGMWEGEGERGGGGGGGGERREGRGREMYRLTVWVESRWETARVEAERREMAAYTGMWEGEGERGGGGGGEGCTG